MLNGTNQSRLEDAEALLKEMESVGKVYICPGSITSSADIQRGIDFAVENYGHVDIWINNAGVNQPMEALWELDEVDIDYLLDVDLIYREPNL